MSEQTSIKRYKVKETWKDYEVTLEVDHAVLTIERATLIIKFWSDDECRLREENGDVVKTAIRLFGQRMINELLSEGGATFCIEYKSCPGDAHRGEIWSKDLQDEEGWGGSIDGNSFGWCGIRLIAADVEAVEFDTVELVEVSQ